MMSMLFLLFFFFSFLSTHGVQVSNDLPNSPFKKTFLARGLVDNPRLLVSRGCSGSSAMMVLARSLLRYHGIPVPKAGMRRIVGNKPAQPLGSGLPAELLNRHTNWFLDEAHDDLGKAMLLAAEYIAKTNQTLFFKGMLQTLQGTGADGDEWASLKHVFKKLNMYAVIGTRENMLDEVICQVKDCFQTVSGFPVDQNGQESDLCFSRRGAPVNPISQLKQTEVSTAESTTFNKIYKAKLHPGNLINRIEYEYGLVDIVRKNLESIGLSPAIVAEEDLLGFQAPVHGAFDKAVTAWSVFLESLGVTPETRIVRSLLRRYRNTHPKPPNHVDVIFNFDAVRAALNNTKYANLLRGPGHF